ncbi:AAA family ATPase [Candidatus Woesebacteria bacterium GWC2_33_12]|uniref:AAA ATPase n=1 Tax=Candidatus Woesebacteria bacterium GW2011_GWB1_33_22 TaxID=1618566 RepID=A0A0G0C2F7_9BACT|nr:MAG: AAA ATPase [Candidatus Woesebacteria bacterium GW2011_GWC2_33_12]KKP42607.1 MAG: AAA ATPase [Candidatus Woesebacteria bacterium GW2011_GWA2_33_20]KKP45350.1 MAG: AAA ATPase [Candidatus Woesebacteria bacterium GW2011_GWB1_33_22]KKP47178.1 MAG: AAA ATPase [Microgenomates group bacterium GW2011_GWC1_33_28]KKP51020.1 MAG: AAA ATPase [Candidatus Woesebacteria bacterium GW2011_GWA1_33_33]OGM07235.1 MAG: AAA family ATPase [Candidatus Woesebacteria bacterium GWC2_33_12]OGM80441.1 MAG: AAA fam
MKFKRILEDTILNKLETSKKGIIVYGPRQAGKTTLVNDIITKLRLKTLFINGDQSQYVDIISSRNLNEIKKLVSGYEMLFIDEAQRIPEIGINLKIILDSIADLKVIVTGSSSLDLASKISEPLTGRVWTYKLYPISTLELTSIYNPIEIDDDLSERLIFGSYPEVFLYNSYSEKYEYLRKLTDAYLYKDLLEYGGLKSSNKIRDLLKLLAFQVGSLVSLSELATTLEMSKDTVSKYIDYLEKSFVIFRLSGFSRNLRKEITKMDKIYFYDIGVRNMLIDNLKPIKDRGDIGKLWENFLIVERIKSNEYKNRFNSNYFWRTHTGAELDLVEEKGGELFGYEIKYSNKIVRCPVTWKKTYKNSKFELINRSNWQEFLTR